ncbi:MAG TPA: DUF5689 domain-containing protein, partial [Pseudobacter sp.]|nr:DUF5689 domain-containing protein [Pseudobacter sp.]
MKRLFYIFSMAGIIAAVGSCNKETYENYPGGEPYEVVSILDVRPLYKGTDVTLTKDKLYGGTKLGAVVISDHTAGNLPKGLLIVQDSRRLSTLRGIAIELASAGNYKPGDSVVVEISNGTLTRKNGILTITGLTDGNIRAAGKGVVNITAVTTAQLKAKPDDYESSLCLLNKSSFNPAPQPGDVISGSKKINDGFGDLV